MIPCSKRDVCCVCVCVCEEERREMYVRVCVWRAEERRETYVCVCGEERRGEKHKIYKK